MDDLQAAVDRAADGDTVVLLPGEHRAPVRIARAIVLAGMPGAVLTGARAGSVVTLQAPGAMVRGLTITGSGFNLETMDSGVFVEKTATGAIVENNRIEGNLFGVYLHGAPDALVRGNEIVGLRQGRVSETGNGISLWNAPGAKIIDNDVRFGRDGIFVITSRRNVISGNRFRDLRFAVHYMYGNEGEITDNVSLGNTIGYALMYSQQLVVRGNLSDRDRDQGMLFNYTNGAQISGNLVKGGALPAARWTTPRGDDGHAVAPVAAGATGTGLRTAPDRCVFVYNANANRFSGNWFEGCETGIHFTAGSERNQISGNAFIGNRNQVKYVGTRLLDWSVNGRGNYWSDNPAFDLNGDGIADTAYRPNDLIDTVLWTAPQAKLLVNSPAVQVIRWAQSQFPALLPGGVVDSRPLIAPPPRPAIAFRSGS
ncbi:MAG: nitrous oxide reductase family maturation protein NosD [Xanthobacteraceae bacterium]|nr:MAG: nitrous oxide reductase family maturation protein NosD [Xanthobacteraceae bacterium]